MTKEEFAQAYSVHVTKWIDADLDIAVRQSWIDIYKKKMMEFLTEESYFIKDIKDDDFL